jgi:hypothetical protein
MRLPDASFGWRWIGTMSLIREGPEGDTLLRPTMDAPGRGGARSSAQADRLGLHEQDSASTPYRSARNRTLRMTFWRTRALRVADARVARPHRGPGSARFTGRLRNENGSKVVIAVRRSWGPKTA